MDDPTLTYRACGAECREDWLRHLSFDNGLPLAEVQRAADRYGEAEDFGRFVDFCEGYRERRQMVGDNAERRNTDTTTTLKPQRRGRRNGSSKGRLSGQMRGCLVMSDR